jgi:hypothetical protein
MPGEDANLRASDADRAEVADALRAHCAAGRITIEELDERVGKAMTARTYGELRELTTDLPALQSPAVPESVAVEPISGRGRGVRPFTMRVEVHGPPERARAVALETIAPGLNGMQFTMRSQSATALEFERRGSHHPLAIVVAVLLFPIGLLALTQKRDEQVTIVFEQLGANRTALIIHGTASRRVRTEFAGLRF